MSEPRDQSGKTAPHPVPRPGPAAADDAAPEPYAYRDLPAAAKRALAEAEARRRAQDDRSVDRPPEIGGRGGPDPVRFGDWEKNGIASDF